MNNNGVSVGINQYNKILNSGNFLYSISSSVFADENEDLKSAIIEYKLFNLFTIKKLRVNILKNENVYFAGGNCVGFDIKSRGAIVVGGNYVITKNGYLNPIKNSGLEIGDIITKINNIEIDSIKTITNYLKSIKNDNNISLVVMRNNNYYEISIKPALDIQSNSYKLGLWLKDNIIGIGTLTFIKDSTNQFGALGHPINTENSINGFDLDGGSIYNCNVLGVKQAENNQPGQLLGSFLLNDNKKGKIVKNNLFGVFGSLNSRDDFILNKKPIMLGGKNSVKPGKAEILCTINGKTIEKFDIEIIKSNYQSGNKDKNMVIRIIDPKLLNKTGGIVQGMSGSPIIQNGKLVGAVTHVFLNDASKGFALHIDNMINELNF